MVEIAPAALSEIRRIQQSRKKNDSFLRISIVEGGCSGYRYQFELCDREGNGGSFLEFGELSVLIESRHLPLLQNLYLDYSEDLMGGGFRFQNKSLSQVCSCGLSFTLPTH